LLNCSIQALDGIDAGPNNPSRRFATRVRLPVKSAIFLTHGEEDALSALREGLVAEGVPPERVIVPQLDDAVDLLDGGGELEMRPVPHRLPPESLHCRDWHNDLAEFSLDLRERLESAADDKARRVILRRMVRAMDAEEET